MAEFTAQQNSMYEALPLSLYVMQGCLDMCKNLSALFSKICSQRIQSYLLQVTDKDVFLQKLSALIKYTIRQS